MLGLIYLDIQELRKMIFTLLFALLGGLLFIIVCWSPRGQHCSMFSKVLGSFHSLNFLQEPTPGVFKR